MNDSNAEKHYTLMLELNSKDGRKFYGEEKKVTVKPWEHRKIPVRLKLPECSNRSEWQLSAGLVPEGGGKMVRTGKALEIFPAVARPVLNRKLYVFDPEGKLVRALKTLQAEFTQLNDLQSVPADGTVVIGRRAFSLSNLIPDLCGLADNGARILILEQDAQCSTELMRVRSRTAFLNAKGHPALAGFKDVDFSCWSGSHSILPAYEENTNGKQWADFGSRNMVAGNVFRRPQHGSYRSLLVSGFDLFQTPLLEYRTKGAWIASSLEMTDRLGTDPAPTHLLVNLISYLDSCGEGRSGTLFFGGPAGEAFLKKMEIPHRKADELTQAALAGVRCLILASPDFQRLKRYRFELNDFVYNGGTVLYLQIGPEFYSTAFPFAMTLKNRTVRQAFCRDRDEDAIWRNGWDNADLYWHFPVEIPCFDNVPPEAESTDPAVLVRKKYGAGSFLFCSILPDSFRKIQADRDTPKMFRFAAEGKTARLLSALLTSCGVRIAKRQNAYLPKKDRQDFIMDLAQYKWSFATDPDNVGLKEKWHSGAAGSVTWMQGLIADGIEVCVGVPFEQFLQRNYDGWAWYRLEFKAPEALLNSDKVYFCAGAIDDFDEVYVNGQLIGKTGAEVAHYWTAPRQYVSSSSLLKKDKNVIAVRVFDEKGNGGLVRLPVSLSNCPSGSGLRGWTSPWPNGLLRDYEYMSDLIRQY